MKKVLMFQGLLFLCASHIPQSHQLKVKLEVKNIKLEVKNYKTNGCGKRRSARLCGYSRK